MTESQGDDRPVVDGTRATPEELRAEVERLSDERRQEVEELREEVGASVHELAERLDVPSRAKERIRTVPPAVWAGAVAVVAALVALGFRRRRPAPPAPGTAAARRAEAAARRTEAAARRAKATARRTKKARR
ncbi:hypothetical protein ACFQH9_18575 [Pseudonocardia lutea]|jgi:hypothetical protein|uniref:DUF3618 domain-containing protein n=1 Tax=Pseudonocardia lutea TaxID=2172015 RepID=A0ABW1IA71_9PSEU